MLNCLLLADDTSGCIVEVEIRCTLCKKNFKYDDFGSDIEMSYTRMALLITRMVMTHFGLQSMGPKFEVFDGLRVNNEDWFDGGQTILPYSLWKLHWQAL